MIIDFNNDFVDAGGYEIVTNNENRGRNSGIREFIHMNNRMKQQINFPHSNYNYTWNYDYAKQEPYRLRDTAVASKMIEELYSKLRNPNHTVSDVHYFDCTKWVPGSLIRSSFTILLYNTIVANSFCDWLSITHSDNTLTNDYNNNNYTFTATLPKLYYEKVFDKRKFSNLCAPNWKGPSIVNTASSGNFSRFTSRTSTEPSVNSGPYFFINDNWNPDKLGGGE